MTENPPVATESEAFTLAMGEFSGALYVLNVAQSAYESAQTRADTMKAQEMKDRALVLVEEKADALTKATYALTARIRRVDMMTTIPDA